MTDIPRNGSLAETPILHDWWQSVHPRWGYFPLFGRVTGHPVLGSSNIHTSDFRAIALDLS